MVDPGSTRPSRARKRRPLAERFWEKVQIGTPDQCWEWATRARTSFGYGRINLGGRGEGDEKAHRVAWVLTNGPIPAGLCVLHRCDNPPCCNPDHLFLGTSRDNTRDMMRKGRMSPPPIRLGEMHHNAKFDRGAALRIKGDRRPARVIAAELGVCEMTVYRHRRGTAWRRAAS